MEEEQASKGFLLYSSINLDMYTFLNARLVEATSHIDIPIQKELLNALVPAFFQPNTIPSIPHIKRQ